MNPLRLLRIYRKADRLFTLMEEGNVKSLWKSKTFWFNLLTAGAELSNVLPLPPGTAIIASSLINIGLRVVTTQAVQVLPKD
tara:strand:- start:446 stop:691 length:246 start_codon:yes stop_codon:yes gene_type:complete